MEDVKLIQVQPQHFAELGRICWEAFHTISGKHGFEDDFPDAQTASRAISMIAGLPGSFAVAAQCDGKLVGSSYMLLTDAVAAIGPVSVDPACHEKGVGRQLMCAAMEHARQRRFERVRLLQDSYNCVALALYTSLGFEVREPVALMKAAAIGLPEPTVRLGNEADLAAMEKLCVRFYKVSRRKELAAWMQLGFPVLVREVAGQIRGYLVPGKIGHGVAENQQDAVSLISQIPRYALPGAKEFFCPLRNPSLCRAALDSGCRIVKVMIVMSMGPYEEPGPVWMPSVGY